MISKVHQVRLGKPKARSMDKGRPGGNSSAYQYLQKRKVLPTMKRRGSSESMFKLPPIIISWPESPCKNMALSFINKGEGSDGICRRIFIIIDGLICESTTFTKSKLIIMSTEHLLITVLIFQFIILVLFLLKRSTGSDKALLQEELARMRKELELVLSQNRREANENLINQFQLVFNSLRAGSKDQIEALKSFGDVFRQNVQDFNALQKEKFEDLNRRQGDLVKTTELRLEKIRETVDEKLQKTLEARLGQSFEMVSNQLQAVQKGLGEMQHLANGVGDLKRVLTNVKSRGVLGEYQLRAILENLLSADQYIVNAMVGGGNRERVEFAVKMPGHDQPVLLPIDSKFPQESYLRLIESYELASKPEIDLHRNELIKSVKKSALDICNKYINPPQTTDFAILFLPVESLYAEILREPGFIQQIQQQYNVLVTGPTTLSAILNSLQMGFRTLAIQKRSSEVWQILGAVKTEFGKFGELLEKTQKKLNEANFELDKLVGARTRVIQRKLKDVQELPEAASGKLLE